MTELPVCRWRGEELSPGRHACSSRRLVVSPRGVSAETCAGCFCRDHEPARPAHAPAAGDVRHLLYHVYPARDDDRRALGALLARLEVYEAPRAFFSDPDPQVGPFDDDAWEAVCVVHGLADFDDPRLWGVWRDALLAEDAGQYGDCGRPLLPTPAPAGSAGKVEEMARRFEWGEELWHPDDGPMDSPDVARVPVLEPKNHKLIGWQSPWRGGRGRGARPAPAPRPAARG